MWYDSNISKYNWFLGETWSLLEIWRSFTRGRSEEFHFRRPYHASVFSWLGRSTTNQEFLPTGVWLDGPRHLEGSTCFPLLSEICPDVTKQTTLDTENFSLAGAGAPCKELPFICLQSIFLVWPWKPLEILHKAQPTQAKSAHSNLTEGREQMMCTFFKATCTFLLHKRLPIRESRAFTKMEGFPKSCQLINSYFERKSRCCYLHSVYTDFIIVGRNNTHWEQLYWRNKYYFKGIFNISNFYILGMTYNSLHFQTGSINFIGGKFSLVLIVK